MKVRGGGEQGAAHVALFVRKGADKYHVAHKRVSRLGFVNASLPSTTIATTAFIMST